MTDNKLSALPQGDAISDGDLIYFAKAQAAATFASRKQTALALRDYASRTLSVESFGAVAGSVSPGQRLLNTIALNNAWTAAIASNGGGGARIKLGPGPYQIDGTWTCPPAPNNSMAMIEGIRGVTRLEQWNAAGGIDTIHFGPPVGNPDQRAAYAGGVRDLWIVSMVDQSNATPLAGHLGAQLSITGANQSFFDGLIIGEYNQRIVDHNHFAYNGLCFDPVGGAYSATFGDIEIKGYGHVGADMSATSSGNYVYNMMIRNGGLGEPALKTSTGPALIIGNGEGTFEQVNIEWSIFGNANPAMYLPSSAGVRFGHLHMEGLQLSQSFAGGRAGFILCPGASMSRFESLHMRSTNLPTGCNIASAALFSFAFAGYSNVSIGQLLVAKTEALGTGVNFYLVNTYEGPGAGAVTNCQIDFVGPWLPFGDGVFASKLTGWSDCNFHPNNKGPANGLGLPPSNFRGRGLLSITTSSPGYSAGVYTQSNNDGNDSYIWNAGVSGTINLAQTIDPQLPVSTPCFPGHEHTVINPTGSGVTCAVHNADGTNCLTAASLSAGQFARFRFNGATGKHQQIAAGTLL